MCMQDRSIVLCRKNKEDLSSKVDRSPLLSAKDAETLTLRLIEALTPGTLTRNQCQWIDAALNTVNLRDSSMKRLRQRLQTFYFSYSQKTSKRSVRNILSWNTQVLQECHSNRASTIFGMRAYLLTDYYYRIWYTCVYSMRYLPAHTVQIVRELGPTELLQHGHTIRGRLLHYRWTLSCLVEVVQFAF